MNYRKITTVLTAMVAGLALSFSAQAGGDKDMDKLNEEQKQLLSQLDTNQDGAISEREAMSHPELAQRFRELDRDNDAVIEKAEFARFEVKDTEDEYPQTPDDMH